jgi:radical SAM superfamily enzyme YgiQ (UPF0313 family)
MERGTSAAGGDILLLQPWIEDFYATDCRSLPLGLAYLAGSIKESFAELEVHIFDFFAAHKRRTLKYPKEFCYLKRYYGAVEKSPSALFHNYYRFGESEEDIIAALKGYRPFLIGISSLFSPYYRQSLALADICKGIFPATPIVFGGNHASLCPETLLLQRHNKASTGYAGDYVIRGEGEESITALIQALKTGSAPECIPNVITRLNLDTAKNLAVVPLRRQELPLPDYCNLDLARYTYTRKPMGFLLTSRSCPHHCNFCSIHAVFGRQYRRRSVEDITTEIHYFYRKGIRHFDIEDDNFSFNQEQCARLLDGILRLKLADISFSAMNGLSYHTLTTSLIEKMKAVGFTDLNLSLVSRQKYLQERSRRPCRGEGLEAVLDAACRSGLQTVVYFIIGLPEQSLEDAVETLCYLAEKKCLIGPSPFYLTPGSPVHSKYQSSKVLRLASAGKDPCFSARLTALDVEKAGFDRDDLYTVFRLTRVVNFLKRLIDQNLTPETEPFAGAIAALSAGEWQSLVQKGSPAPFSTSAHGHFIRYFHAICGYKSPASYRILLPGHLPD